LLLNEFAQLHRQLLLMLCSCLHPVSTKLPRNGARGKQVRKTPSKQDPALTGSIRREARLLSAHNVNTKVFRKKTSNNKEIRQQ